MGGAVSLLWHEQAGPVFAATTNRYALIEAPNMQSNSRKYIMSGTPRVEWCNTERFTVIWTTWIRILRILKKRYAPFPCQYPSGGCRPADSDSGSDSRNVGLCVFPTGLVDRNGTLPFDRLPGFTGYRRAFGSCGYYAGRHAPSEKGRRVGGSLRERQDEGCSYR